jgi:hypothetical protein
VSVGPIPNSYWVVDDLFAAGEYPGALSGDEATKRLRQFLDAGIRVFLDLTEEDDGLTPYEAILKEESARLGVGTEWHRLPIRDVSVPTIPQMRQIQRAIRDAMDAGKPVYVHCWGGIGRTGTTVGCFLVDSGLSGPEALRRLTELWQVVQKRWRKPRTPETREQEQFVLNWQPREGMASTRLNPLGRMRGCLLGGAVGDALGAPVEFMSLHDIRAQFGSDGLCDMVAAYGRVGAITGSCPTSSGVLRAGHSLTRLAAMLGMAHGMRPRRVGETYRLAVAIARASGSRGST